MLSTKRVVISILLILSVIASACAQATPEVSQPETVTIRETVVVQETVVVTELEEVERLITPTAAPGRQTIIVALSRTPLTLDPADYSHRETETVIRNMFDGLITRDTRSGTHFELAESMEWLDDTTLEIKIHQGVLFHNGQEMTADDVIFTYERIMTDDSIEYPEPHSSPRRGFWAQWNR
jgi:ABC-type transport system substrate-binding protein